MRYAHGMLPVALRACRLVVSLEGAFVRFHFGAGPTYSRKNFLDGRRCVPATAGPGDEAKPVKLLFHHEKIISMHAERYPGDINLVSLK